MAGAGADSLANAVEIRFGQGRSWFIGRFEKPCLEFRGNFKGEALLLAKGADKIVNQLVRVRADARAHLLLQKALNILCNRDCHAANCLSMRPACQTGDTLIECPGERTNHSNRNRSTLAFTPYSGA